VAADVVAFSQYRRITVGEDCFKGLGGAPEDVIVVIAWKALGAVVTLKTSTTVVPASRTGADA
jgi:fructose-1,6-bisphosphatase/sedoheptulose 1,7-bisphosphatase-like protein